MKLWPPRAAHAPRRGGLPPCGTEHRVFVSFYFKPATRMKWNAGSDMREAEGHGCDLQRGDSRVMAAGRLSFQTVAPKRKSQRTPSWSSSTREMKKNHHKLDRERCSSSEGLCLKHLCSRNTAITPGDLQNYLTADTQQLHVAWYKAAKHRLHTLFTRKLILNDVEWNLGSENQFFTKTILTCYFAKLWLKSIAQTPRAHDPLTKHGTAVFGWTRVRVFLTPWRVEARGKQTKHVTMPTWEEEWTKNLKHEHFVNVTSSILTKHRIHS